MSEATTGAAEFVWEPQPAAMAVVRGLVDELLERSEGAKTLATRMTNETGTRFIDWVDSIVVPASRSIEGTLRDVGFTTQTRESEHAPAQDVFVHLGGMFPTIVIGNGQTLRVSIKVEAVLDYLAAHSLTDIPIAGGVGMPLRSAVVAQGEGVELAIIERHGDTTFVPRETDPSVLAAHAKHFEALRLRPRCGDEAACFATCHKILDASIAEIGVDATSDLFFRSERGYWQSRNRAAQVQYGRQQKLGLGWANHDHHTYRSSREQYTSLISVLEKVGMRCRERFYAGGEAGWGAQVLEQPRTGFVVFADVDMEPHEVEGDFAHEGFPQKDELGTVGLWCALHGEAVLEAGMHHLECQFDWHALVAQLESEAGIKTMAPFTTFPFLRQAFTEGERWSVRPERIEKLLGGGKISAEDAETFRSKGAVGSHLENLERNDGYKGFNQTGVSDIISRTDPRKLANA